MKITKVWGLENLQTGLHIHILGGWYPPTPQGKKFLCFGPFQTSPYVSLIWLSICLLYHMLYYIFITGKCKKVFPWILWAVIPNDQIKGRGLWELPICSQFGQKLWITWGPTTCNWHPKWKAVAWDWACTLWDPTLSLRQIVSELS